MVLVMPNTSVAVKLQPTEHSQLMAWETSHGTPQQVALRCRIILGAVAGQDNGFRGVVAPSLPTCGGAYSTRQTRSYVPKAPIKIGKEKRMEDPYDEGIANRIGPESCVGDREVAAKR